jgi:hypothetical protein
VLEKFPGIEKAKKDIEDGIQASFKMVNEIDTAERGLLSNWKFKNMKRANKIRKNNKLLLYKSCIIKIVSTNWIDLIQDVFIQNDPMRRTNDQDLEIVLKDGTKIHCAVNTAQQSTILDYLKLLRSLKRLASLGGQKTLFVICDEIEKKALLVIRMKRWNIDVRNLKA